MLDYEARRVFQLQRRKLLTPVTIGVYFYLLTGLNGERYTMRKIAAETGFSYRAVRYNLPVLELCSLIEIVDRKSQSFAVVVRVASAPEVREAITDHENLASIQRYRFWQYAEKNKFHGRKRRARKSQRARPRGI